MAAIFVDSNKVHEFTNAGAFYDWLGKNHSTETEVWIRIHKVSSGLPSITPVEAIDAALCWGWIDAVRKSLNETSYLQRYTPRGKKSVWSQVNVGNVARLVQEGRMTEHGLKHVDAAKEDGRWDKAYRSSKSSAFPPDLQAAIDAEPAAKKMFGTLTAQNRFALAFRTENMKTEAGRQKKIASFVEMLKRGETFYAQGKKS